MVAANPWIYTSLEVTVARLWITRTFSRPWILVIWIAINVQRWINSFFLLGPPRFRKSLDCFLPLVDKILHRKSQKPTKETAAHNHLGYIMHYTSILMALAATVSTLAHGFSLGEATTFLSKFKRQTADSSLQGGSGACPAIWTSIAEELTASYLNTSMSS